MPTVDPFTAVMEDPARVEALRHTGIPSDQFEEVFGEIGVLAGEAASAPWVTISFVEARSEVFRYRAGVPIDRETECAIDLSRSLGRIVVGSGKYLTVDDLSREWPARDRAAVSDWGAVSYLGVPFRAPEGHCIGVLAVMDTRPRLWTRAEVAALEGLGYGVTARIAQAAAAQRARNAEAELQSVTAQAPCIAWTADVEDQGGEYCVWHPTLFNPRGAARFLPLEGPLDGPLDGAQAESYLAAWRRHCLPNDRLRRDQVANAAIRAGTGYTVQFRCRERGGRVRWFNEEVQVATLGVGRWRAMGVCTDLTQEKLAREALELSEARYQALFHANPLPLWVYSEESLAFLAVNDLAVLRYGYSRDQFLKMTVRDIRPPEELPALERYLSSAASEGFERSGVWQHRTQDGTLIDVEITSHPLEFAGQPARLVMANDVTKRVRAERLRDRLVEILEATPDLVAITHIDGPVDYINPAGRRLLGVSDEGPVSLSEYRPARFRRFMLEEAIPQAIREGVWAGETCFRSRSGCEIPVSQVLLAHRGERGDVQYLSTIVRDISDHKRAEEQSAVFQALGHMLNSAATSEEAGSAILGMADGLLGWDSCWLQLPGTDGVTLETGLFMDLVAGDRRDVSASRPDRQITPLARKVLETGPVLLPTPEGPLAEVRAPFGDTARRSASLLAVPIRTGDRAIGALSIQSYTPNAYSDADLQTLQALADYCSVALERTRARAAEKVLEEQLRHAGKMEAIGRLAGGVAHDFNNMLGVITGYSALLLSRPLADEGARAALSEIQLAAERATGLTRQLLAFSRKQVLTPRLLDLNEVVTGIEKLLRRLIGEDVELVTRLAPGLGSVEADPGQLEQVIVNLAINARDVMPGGGRLTLETLNVELDGSCADLHAELDAGAYVMLAVTDTGCGMDAETRGHIFEPFFTTKVAGQGTGLGLATVHGIIQQSGGHARVYSELGQGTTFRLYFPQASRLKADAPRIHPAERPFGRLAGRQNDGWETILVVEDEEQVQGIIRLSLVDHGYRVLTAGGAWEALALCREYEGPIHLLLTDVVLCGQSGRELSDQAVVLRPEMRVLFMSGYTEDTVVLHRVLKEDMPFLEKPFSPAALARKVREVLS